MLNIPQYKATKFLTLLGGLKDILSRMSFYVQLGTMIMVAANLWDTSIMRNVRTEYTWLSFWVFIFAIGFVILVILLLEYVFLLPGSWAFYNEQFNKHQNEVTINVRTIKENQDLQDKKLNEMYEKVMGKEYEEADKEKHT